MFRKLLLAFLVSVTFLGATLTAENTAQANHIRWGHRGWGGWGHRGWGHGVFRPHVFGHRHWGGYRGWGGHRHWGGYAPRYYAGYRPWGWGGYGRRAYGWGGWGYGGWPYVGNYYYPAYTSFSYPVYSYPATYYSYPISGCVDDVTYSTGGYSTGVEGFAPVVTNFFANMEPSKRESLSGLEQAITQTLRRMADPNRLATRAEASRAPAASYSTESLAVREARSTLAVRDFTRLMAAGDDAFRAGRYKEALARYEESAERTPSLAEAEFRQGHALVALGRFEEANLAFRRGIGMGGDPSRGGFRLSEIYGSKADEAVHVEALAANILERKDRASGYFLLGMTLHYSTDAAQAGKFFQKAAALSTDASYLASYVPAAAKPSAGTKPSAVVSARLDEI